MMYDTTTVKVIARYWYTPTTDVNIYISELSCWPFLCLYFLLCLSNVYSLSNYEKHTQLHLDIPSQERHHNIIFISSECVAFNIAWNIYIYIIRTLKKVETMKESRFWTSLFYNSVESVLDVNIDNTMNKISYKHYRNQNITHSLLALWII